MWVGGIIRKEDGETVGKILLKGSENGSGSSKIR